MAQAAAAHIADAGSSSREDFAKMIDESFSDGHLQEGSVVKGTVVGIEKDLAVIDVGLKTEGRVALREFSGPGRNADIKIGDTVEVYLERVENALGEAVLSRDRRAGRKAGASWKRRSRITKRCRASSSIRSRAASRSISTAPWPSCRAPRSISGPSATSPR